MDVTSPSSAIRDCTIGIDLGTTNLKAALFDANGTLLSTSEAALTTHRPARDRVEQDPEEWWSALQRVLRALISGAPGVQVVGVAICAQVGSHVFVDEYGGPLTQAWLWQDARSHPVLGELGQRARAAADVLPLGFTVDTASALSRVGWLAREDTVTWDRVRYVLTPKDYLNFRLVGEFATDAMSQYGLVDDEGVYLPGLELVVPGVTRAFPAVQDFRAPLGSVRPWGESEVDAALAGAVVAVGTMDAYGNLFGSGADHDSSAIEVAGTCEIVGVQSSLDREPAGVIKFPPIDGLRLYAGPTKAGGAAVEWFARVLGVTVVELMDLVADAEPSGDPLVFQPYLEGERAPIWDEEVRGTFVGLTGRHDRRDMARAVVEGVALSGRHLLEAAEKSAGREVGAVRLSGGGSRSDLACQIRADVLGRKVERVSVRNSGVLGAALIAAIAAGVTASIAEAGQRLVHIDRVFVPTAYAHRRYDEIYAVYRELYPALSSPNAALARLRRAL